MQSSLAIADTAYVTDLGEFHLRSGASTRHRIMRMLPSGTEVEVIAEDKDNGYTQVRLSDNTIGFILSRYLQEEPAARERLTAIQTRLNELQQEPGQLAAKLSKLEIEHAALKTAYEKTLRRKEQLDRELIEIQRAAANVVDITQERASLQENIALLTGKVGELEQENLVLRNRDQQRWFLIGATVAGGGVVLGLMLPYLRLRRRANSWSNF
ncbi:TIGR04211 family SH3 domain-containing protein [Thiospirillum jenense]|uniref:TIGR04211 family SH3 domain-containing protein n=2 Tax=Thiospirillum jenense TaxID=1653858 RepID=A0A839HEK9_9GAMM|nr:TIGR04211 family SH3 domain-containing protein [Thiospirillum jenense]